MEFLGKKFAFKGGEVKEENFSEAELVGLYFSASWCGPCRFFTPLLKEFYEEMNRKKKVIEIVFVSKDYTEYEFGSYFKTMPWLAIPFTDRARLNSLSSRFKVFGIPTLIILGKNGNVLTRYGVTEIEEKGLLAVIPWLQMSKK